MFELMFEHMFGRVIYFTFEVMFGSMIQHMFEHKLGKMIENPPTTRGLFSIGHELA